MLHRVVWSKFTDILEVLTASIIRVIILISPESGDSFFPQNVGFYLQAHKTLNPEDQHQRNPYACTVCTPDRQTDHSTQLLFTISVVVPYYILSPGYFLAYVGYIKAVMYHNKSIILKDPFRLLDEQAYFQNFETATRCLFIQVFMVFYSVHCTCQVKDCFRLLYLTGERL
jgi:hypothetical protein